MAFRIVVDTREQEPYPFPCATIHKPLEAGDYSVDGYEHRLAVERKSLKDFYKTVIHDRARFGRELEKLKIFAAACVVVEADLRAMLSGHYAHSLRSVAPSALLGASLEITLRHRVPVFWCGSRAAAREFTEHYLRMFIRLHPEKEER